MNNARLARYHALWIACSSAVLQCAAAPAPYVADAPLQPADLRKLVVAQDGSGDHTTIQTAVDAAGPGDTILVKDGSYAERVVFRTDGTAAQPIALARYPGHRPKIRPGTGSGRRVEFNAEWIILDGFDIAGGYDGCKVYKDHVTIRNCHIHDNHGQGILLVSVNDVLIENNVIERNGLTNKSPMHIHGVYLSDFFERGMRRITIRANIFRGHGGGGIHHWNKGKKKEAGARECLIENNLFENNVWELILWSGFNGNVIRNNTLVHVARPETNIDEDYAIGFNGSSGNVVRNNVIYFRPSRGTSRPFDTRSKHDQIFENNLWSVPPNSPWRWQRKLMNDFAGEYRATTGYDANGLLADPKFVNVAAKDYHLAADSPAIGRADPAHAPEGDLAGRLRDSRPDLGAYEYAP
ncbi:MAG: right-handed parallel beta-helix repeat-containing protein [Kiritimatiellae bacterium]|nr:right-handed parallel beta-helix repeat-containing protein [Kiritimatiellia bacterium]